MTELRKLTTTDHDLSERSPEPRPAQAPLSHQSQLAIWAQRMLRARAGCMKFFPKNVFRDAAWDMMLELVLAGEKQQRMCVKDLMLVSGETPTGTMRRIERLEEAELIRRKTDNADHRRVIVTLTEKGQEAMTSLLHSMYDVDGHHRAPPKGPVSFSPARPKP